MTTKPEARRFAPPPGVPFVAMNAGAASAEYGRAKPAPFEMQGRVAIVRVCGPLSHRDYGWFDSYDAIRERMGAAFAARPSAVVMALDTPGGEVSGCFELARDLRAMSASAKIPLLSYADGMACSAGYALACAGERISAPRTAIVGSVGVITTMWDVSAMLEQAGIHVEVIASGERKADGYPYKPIDDAAKAATQTLINDLALMFFELGAECRPRLTVDALRAMEAGVFLADRAVANGLIDDVGSLEALVASANARVMTGAAASKGRKTMPKAHRSTLKPLIAESDEEKTDETEEKEETEAAAESVDLASLREAMSMPDEPGQEVVDAAAKKISGASESEQSEEDAEGKGEKSAASRIASLEASLATLQSERAADKAKIAKLEHLAAAEDKRLRDAKVDAAMAKHNVAAAHRARFVELADKHGIVAAEAAIAASGGPPTGVIAPNPNATSTGATDPALDASGGDDAKTRAVRVEAERIRQESPAMEDHKVQRAAMSAARQKHPHLFAATAA